MKNEVRVLNEFKTEEYLFRSRSLESTSGRDYKFQNSILGGIIIYLNKNTKMYM